MKKMLKISWQVTKYLLLLVLLILGYFVTVIVVNTRADYKPDVCDTLVKSEKPGQMLYSDSIGIISWNIGYCSLGKELDFFYDGGKSMRAPKDVYERYLQAVFDRIESFDTIPFVLLQEVDFGAKRSYRTPQDSLFAKALPTYSQVRAINYKVPYVPFPLFNPMGRVLSGMQTLSRLVPVNATRVSFPSSYSFPMGVFFLDRCFIVSRYSLGNGKELVIVNTHNSAFDDAEELRKTEMLFLRSFLLNEYARGNYVIAGGDWNQNPPGYNPLTITSGDRAQRSGTPVPSNYYPEGWQWIYDKSSPSNRDVDSAYQKGKTPVTILDFFLVSPNVQVNYNYTVNLGFEHSDHNPIYMNVTLLPDATPMDSMAVYNLMKEKQKTLKKKK